MKLPLVDEIRVARALCEEAYAANMVVHRVEAALTSVRIVEQQVRMRPDLEAPLPGIDVIEEAAEKWDQLSDLTSHNPRSIEPMLNQLATRRGQLQLAQQVLRPIASDSQQRTAVLHELQHRQRHQLESPEWASQISELTELGAERDRLAQELGPLDKRLSMVDPALGILRSFLERIDDEESRREVPDPRGHNAWRAVTLASSLVKNLKTVLDHVELEVPLPIAPEAPPKPDPELVPQMWAGVESVKGILEDLRDILGREGTLLTDVVMKKRKRHTDVTQAIVERMG